jgi:hypothetical protein
MWRRRTQKVSGALIFWRPATSAMEKYADIQGWLWLLAVTFQEQAMVVE